MIRCVFQLGCVDGCRVVWMLGCSPPGNQVEIICTGMAANPTIVSLDLSHNLISDVGCVALQKVLEAKNTVLMFLNLCNNKIHGIGKNSLGIIWVPANQNDEYFFSRMQLFSRRQP